MPFLSTRTHGVVDYVVGLFLGTNPWLFGFDDHTAATVVAVAFGAMVMLLAILTNFRFGRWRQVPVAVHLVLEGLIGVGLITAPFILGFADAAWIPMVACGALLIGLAIITRRRPGPGIEPLLGAQRPDHVRR